jgi:hypothetical protein
MLPVVVIGADDIVREAFDAWNGEVEWVSFYDTAEDASFGLDDRITADAKRAEPDPSLPVPSHDETGRWHVSVVYGPLAFGPLTTGQPAKLAHNGWTILADAELKNDQRKPRRVRGQVVEGEHAQTMVFEAMARAQANFVVDVALASGDASLGTLRELMEARERP